MINTSEAMRQPGDQTAPQLMASLTNGCGSTMGCPGNQEGWRAAAEVLVGGVARYLSMANLRATRQITERCLGGLGLCFFVERKATEKEDGRATRRRSQKERVQERQEAI